MSDLPPTPDLAALVEELRAQVGGLRAANARLREVVVSKAASTKSGVLTFVGRPGTGRKCGRATRQVRTAGKLQFYSLREP